MARGWNGAGSHLCFLLLCFFKAVCLAFLCLPFLILEVMYFLSRNMVRLDRCQSQRKPGLIGSALPLSDFLEGFVCVCGLLLCGLLCLFVVFKSKCSFWGLIAIVSACVLDLCQGVW